MAVLSIKKLRLGVIVFYCVIFVGLALYDERPDPNMIREMNVPLAACTGPGNAYIVFLGFESPKGKTPYEWGFTKLQEVEKAVANGTEIAESRSSIDSKEERLIFKGERPTFYDKKDNGILKYISAHSAEAAKLTGENRELLNRYKSLRTYTEFREPVDLGYYMPIFMFSSIRSAHVLYLFEIAGTAKEGNIAGALEALQGDIDFWGHISQNSTTLISKLVSLSPLTTDIRFAAELGTIRRLRVNEMAQLRNVLRSFDNRIASMAGPLRGEARYMYKGAELSIYRNSRPIEGLFFKRNATDNRMYANIRQLVRLAELPSEKFVSQAKAHEGEKNTFRKAGIPFLYNPLGEILSVIVQSQGHTTYIQRGHDLEGLRRLAWLKVLAKHENVRPEQMERFLNARSAEFKDPYTGGAMKWDANKGSIYFEHAIDDNRVEMFL